MGRILNKDIQVKKNTQNQLAAKTFKSYYQSMKWCSLNVNFALERLGCCRENQGNFSSESSIRMCLWGVPTGWKPRCEIFKNPALNVSSDQCGLGFLNLVLLVCKEKKFGDASASPPVLAHPLDSFKVWFFPQCPFSSFHPVVCVVCPSRVGSMGRSPWQLMWLHLFWKQVSLLR